MCAGLLRGRVITVQSGGQGETAEPRESSGLPLPHFSVFISFHWLVLKSLNLYELTLCIFQAQSNVFVCTRYRQRQTQQGCCLRSRAESCGRLGRRLSLHRRLGDFTDRRLQSRCITRGLRRSPSVRPPRAHQSAASPPASVSIWPRTCACIMARVHECVHTLRQPRGWDGEGGGREGTCVFRWAIHAAAWQSPSQCGKGIIL